ncbi:right-handed parallel beta-helix repeat-containing protein [Cerasicoccus maritimus]|uniref:right-handed parallel beta-helix repeat-containing protein n=1 Tax=Cerasicoccus maritimus TaxID=490089 RepID=UPI0028527CBF|nr:right-handed parallel beta-helix repeat-containing protein [Cerasicoccus maritimus]
MLNILDFGAVGDGKTDNTRAIQAALDKAGESRTTVYVPDGRFCTGALRMRPFTGLVGNPAWGFRDVGGSILELIDPKANCLIDISHAGGININGLSLNGGELGEGVHGIKLEQPDYGGYGQEATICIERCRVDGFTGHGLFFKRIWCFSVRHCMISHNRGDGIWLRGWDGFIMDNWLTGNGKAGFGAYEENASVTFTANRIEWNYGPGMTIEGGDHYNITGNFFDRSGGPAIDIKDRDGVPSSQLTLTGNIFYRNGKPSRCGNLPYDSSHLRIIKSRGIVISSNVAEVSADDPNSESRDASSPDYGLVIGELESAIIKDNVFDRGYKKELLVDLGKHGTNVVLKDNIGCIHPGICKAATA